MPLYIWKQFTFILKNSKNMLFMLYASSFPFYSGKVYRFLGGRLKIILSLVLSLCFYLGDVFVWSCPHRRGFFDQYCRLSSLSFISLDFFFAFKKPDGLTPEFFGAVDLHCIRRRSSISVRLYSLHNAEYKNYHILHVCLQTCVTNPTKLHPSQQWRSRCQIQLLIHLSNGRSSCLDYWILLRNMIAHQAGDGCA